ncbi:glycosyltransferase family 2 protein [Chryseobacterium manosquense]|uniref:Glycosyltransferase family 2 protein n=1 Tax=Chryseobacterium manosquense TaxID=2754694 RepID=A0A7H1DUH2_9FLAO|nr:glycosyltransferase family A protein [Chryseobacterium manosquense]QNS40630.1 glycosyltransferase family 2 protein [Chryseobacterium manosquense]
MSINPKLSVILPAYNAEKHIAEAVESILNQTFSDFEFIIIEDHSTDNTLAVLKNYAARDERIILTEKPENKDFKGYVENLNLGLAMAKGKYVARMDADDIALPTRLEKQMNILENNSDIFMVGCSLKLIDEVGNTIGVLDAKQNHNEIVRKFNMENAMFHPALMFRNNSKVKYRDKMHATEDFDFYLQHLADGARFYNIPEYLMDYRILKKSLSRTSSRLIKMLFLEKAKHFYKEKVSTGSDTYADMNDEDLKKILKNDKILPKEILLFGLDTALMYNMQNEAQIIYSKLKEFYDYRSYKSLLLSNPMINMYSYLRLKKVAQFGIITNAQ